MPDTVTPSPAASLLVYRVKADQTVEIVLGRRPSKSRFMPDVFVYPGGMVDPPDARVRSASPLDTSITARMAVANSHARARTIAAAAIRETFEETGLLITRQGDPGNIKHDTWQVLRGLNQAPDLSSLHYVARAITPADQKIRFHARFFAVNFSDLDSGKTASLSGNGELLDLDWYPVDSTVKMPLRTVTRFMLSELKALRTQGKGWIGDKMFTQRNGKPFVSRWSNPHQK